MNTPLLLLGALGGYGVLMWSSPVRTSLVDGVRAVRRYPALAGVPGSFGFAYALFQLGARAYLSVRQPAEGEPLWQWTRAPFRPGLSWWLGAPDAVWHLAPGALGEAARGALGPMLDSTAGLFNCLGPTFPLAALAALGLLLNLGGHQGVMGRALRRQFGRRGLVVHGLILLGALAALAKPGLYALPPALAGSLWVPAVNWLGFQFEYLFGVFVQLVLLSLAYCWVRGLSFRPRELLAFAVRRCAFVLRWAAVMMVLSTVLIDLPLLLGDLPGLARWRPADAAEIDRRLFWARMALDCTFLTWCSVQLTLTLHNESLRQSLADHLRFLGRHWWPLGWFLLLAALHCYALQLVNGLGQRGLGDATALGAGWALAFPWLAGLAGAWLLASWVSLFKRLEAGRLGDRHWVSF